MCLAAESTTHHTAVLCETFILNVFIFSSGPFCFCVIATVSIFTLSGQMSYLFNSQKILG